LNDFFSTCVDAIAGIFAGSIKGTFGGTSGYTTGKTSHFELKVFENPNRWKEQQKTSRWQSSAVSDNIQSNTFGGQR
jgi:hypothetical protein